MDLPSLDLASPEFRRDPFPIYEKLCAHAPVLHRPASGAWLLFDYASVRKALTEQDHFSSNMRHANRSNPDWLVFLDTPRHPRFRALISKASTRRCSFAVQCRRRSNGSRKYREDAYPHRRCRESLLKCTSKSFLRRRIRRFSSIGGVSRVQGCGTRKLFFCFRCLPLALINAAQFEM